MNWPQKNAKDHKENKQSKFLSMRSLRSFAAIILPKMKSFLKLHCRERGETTAKKIGHLFYLRDLFGSARKSSFREGRGWGCLWLKLASPQQY
jgi:hypothetical protein